MPPPTYDGLSHEHDLRPGAHVDVKGAEEEAVFGGLKRPTKAVLQIPGLGVVGEGIHRELFGYLADHQHAVAAVHEAIRGSDDQELPERHVQAIRELLGNRR